MAAKKKARPPARRARRASPARVRRLIAAGYLQGLLQQYAWQHNPLSLWRAYKVSRDASLPIPEEALSYFDRAAAKFWKLSERGHTPPTSPSSAIAEALEMKRPGQSGRGTVFTSYDLSGQAALASAAAQERQGIYFKRYLAFKRVAKAHGTTEAKVKAAFKIFKDALEVDGARQIKK
jgi:hypothetical protein